MNAISVSVVIGAVHNNVVVGIAIIRNQHTAIVVAGKFDFVNIDLVHWRMENLSVDLNHGVVFVHCSVSNLGADVRASCDIEGTSSLENIDNVGRWGNGLCKAIRVGLRVDGSATTHDDVVLSDSIVGNEDTSVVVACELDLGWVDLVNRSSEALTIGLHDGFCLADCGRSELRVHRGSNFNISSNVQKLDSVGAELLSVGIVQVQGIVEVLVETTVRVWHIHVLWMSNDHIIVRVSIVRDQGTTVVVACELDLGWVDMANGCKNRLAIVLDDSICLADSGGSDFRVDIGADRHVASDYVESIAVSAHRHGLMVNVVIVVIVMRAVEVAVIKVHITVHVWINNTVID